MVLKKSVNAKMDFETYAQGTEKIIRICQNSARETKPVYFKTFLPISQDLVDTNLCVETLDSSWSF